jgi:pyruvate, water dikinase
MFDLTNRKGRGLGRSKVLELEIPLVFRVLNLEQGLSEEGEKLPRVTMDHVICKPFQAMFSGLAHETIEWDPNISHFDWEEFDKVSAGVFDPTKSALLSSYGLLAGDYMHVLIRFGYHFVIVDSLLGPDKEQNYIQFSFKGGGAEEAQRVMRLEAIRLVFQEFGFNIEVRGDLLKAEYNRENYEKTYKRLQVVGYILGRTRLKDMSMNEEKIQILASEYIREIKALPGDGLSD